MHARSLFLSLSQALSLSSSLSLRLSLSLSLKLSVFGPQGIGAEEDVIDDDVSYTVEDRDGDRQRHTEHSLEASLDRMVVEDEVDGA